MSKILCIYHGNCADGFGAAWAVRHALGDRDVEFHAGVYGNPPPDVSAIAKSYGGGGHRNASGFRMPIGWEGDSQ